MPWLRCTMSQVGQALTRNRLCGELQLCHLVKNHSQKTSRQGLVTKFRQTLSLLTCWLLLTLCISATAYSSSFGPRFALVIGNGAYVSAALRNPVRDAQAVAAALRRLGFVVTLLTDASHREMLRAIASFTDQQNASTSIGLFYFAGHGFQLEGKNYLLGVDWSPGRKAAALRSSVDVTQILNAMNATGSRADIMILDACRDNPFSSTVRSLRGGLADPGFHGETLVAYATAPGSVAQDGEDAEHSVFTKQLLDNIEAPNLGITQLFKRLRKGVINETDREQRPYFNSSITTEVYLNSMVVPSTIFKGFFSTDSPKGALNEMASWNLIKNSSTSEHYRAYLSAFPDSKFSPLARIRLNRLEGQSPSASPGTIASTRQASSAPPDPIGPVPTFSVSDLISRAQFALKLQRLTFPTSDNAVLWAERALAREPQNQEARQLLAQVVGKYQAWAKSQFRRGQHEQARKNLLRSLSLLRYATEKQRQEQRALEHELYSKLSTPVLAPPQGTDSQAATSQPPPLFRYPTVETRKRVTVGQVFSVQISLTEGQITPSVTVTQGKTNPAGALALALPEPQDSNGWAIDLLISAPGFEIIGSESASIELPEEGDSTVARFQLRAEAISPQTETLKVYITFWHKNAYLARVERTIEVLNDTIAPQPLISPQAIDPAPPASNLENQRAIARAPAARTPAPPGRDHPTQKSQDIVLPVNLQAPSLTLLIQHGEPRTPSNVCIVSPFLQPSCDQFNLTTDFRPWLEHYFSRFNQVGQGRGVGLPGQPLQQKEHNIALLEGFGRELYRRFAPEHFKRTFWTLMDQTGKEFNSIQVITNDPLIPWELMKPVRDGPIKNKETGFLGIDFRVGRWHINNKALQRPPQHLKFDELAFIAPSYTSSPLPEIAREASQLSSIAGFKKIEGDYSSVSNFFSLTNRKSGIVHFAGHGQAKQGPAGLTEYSIRLEDSDLDLMTWRGLLHSADRDIHPLLFFNTCDLGKAKQVANFVDGWAPAALETGAGGYIGSLWPLADSGAAEFSRIFYQDLFNNLDKSGQASIADSLREARSGFYVNGDPSFLAYVFFSDPNLLFEREPVVSRIP